MTFFWCSDEIDYNYPVSTNDIMKLYDIQRSWIKGIREKNMPTTEICNLNFSYYL